ncbi:NAD-dependent epimerase/dehydratase family protein [Bradyrhizobium sp. ISRA443]|uniref:NAD-dependent epimerase/dehydratase family protein n=1 Tax=unclassified Bradyrhizobium TaxID=2631580 RepID=UPI0024797299|nr:MULTISPECIES: NAD-dependent epimerase/dehydratase family protein [unclassified Bradyrhizobium]WGR91208.1 NAD-dependent epimerase/dehydratase family protein [Bradyrhizobium sp. ISRA435]WGS01419.1 NAD-dependent epimerase/dehydratase family protein [Bradyrhizobium sp. ISRA436]WGS08306.1 NAD-dependent epimerase/dehydratase family protein [Bradyrhizobium sp. ISRA437]WGS15194.1 NAD-dependent epimerase/dehydratase family protein [Bradyrhizobium sp. ISRA443]
MRGRKTALVTGAGGFIGHHLVKYLVGLGYSVRGADIKCPEYEETAADEFMIADLRDPAECLRVTNKMDEVYHLAADMGGIGYITAQHAEITINNTLIDAHMLQAAQHHGVKRFLFSSSACVYPQYLQRDSNVVPLREDDAFPADPEEGYGLEKLYTEKLCQYFTEDWHLPTRVVRFHNVYGPLGTYDGGREKAPAALSRKIAVLHSGDELQIWGDGKQTRSFMYIDDCVEGIHRIMQSDYSRPLNLGTDELVTVDELVDIIAAIAGKSVIKHHDTSKPQGVRGRNSDNSRLRTVLGWEPKTTLRQGLVPTYRWIEERVLGKPDLSSIAAA